MASTLMKQVPPLPGEEALYRWIAEAEMITPFLQWRYNGRPAGNGWNSPVNNAEWGTDYLNRTPTGKSNSYDNRPEKTKYIYTDDDSQGQQLNGQNTYTVTFAKGQVPPVKGFWSLTLYNEEHSTRLSSTARGHRRSCSVSIKPSEPELVTDQLICCAQIVPVKSSKNLAVPSLSTRAAQQVH